MTTSSAPAFLPISLYLPLHCSPARPACLLTSSCHRHHLLSCSDSLRQLNPICHSLHLALRGQRAQRSSIICGSRVTNPQPWYRQQATRRLSALVVVGPSSSIVYKSGPQSACSSYFLYCMSVLVWGRSTFSAQTPSHELPLLESHPPLARLLLSLPDTASRSRCTVRLRIRFNWVQTVA